MVWAKPQQSAAVDDVVDKFFNEEMVWAKILELTNILTFTTPADL